ncbi:MAG: hypothetical protein QXN37_02060 [Candidatus Anstonellaceae archaeon]
MKAATLFAAVFLLTVGFVFAGTASCQDGTKHGSCSKVNPGLYCIDGKLHPYVSFCPCSAVPGWKQQGEGENAVCVQEKCADGTESGKCSSDKPKQCVGGRLIDNATACGCPPGKIISQNGLTCVFLPCNDSGVSVPEGTCSPKSAGKKCVEGKLVDKASECPCGAGTVKKGERCVVLCEDGTEVGSCSPSKPKECVLSGLGVGVLLDNASKCGCPPGMETQGNRCIEAGASLPSLSGGAETLTETLNGSGTEPQQEEAQPLSCFCCPSAFAILLLLGMIYKAKDSPTL